MANITRDITSIVFSQLPATLKEKVSVEIISDPYNLKVEARFATKTQKWTTALEDMEFHGVPCRCKIPETFLAQLCVVV